MGIVYILTTIILMVAFLLLKKSNEKQNIVTWIILSLITYLAYNIFVCMLFGSLNIHTNLIFLSVVNLLISVALGIIIYKKKVLQQYYFDKKSILPLILILGIVIFVGIKQYKPFEDSIATASVDGCMHYAAATNFADNMIILSKIDNQTGYNFLTMQPGAYVNTGIQMSVARSIFGENAKDYITFKVFEMGIFALNIAAIYMLITDKIDSKYKMFICMILIALYAFAYPYTSLLYGFSYLGVAIAFCTAMFYLAKVYAREEINFVIETILIVLIGVGIIFSYCLFVPAMFAFICINVFVYNKDEKRKILKKETMIITGILLLVTILGILYLVIPTFLVESQNKLTDAIGFDGNIYKGFYIDFIFYVPFVIVFLYKAIKNKKLSPILIAFLVVAFQLIISLVGLLAGIVSAYYYYKIYYIIYVLLVYIAMEIICEYSNNKELQTFIVSALAVFVAIVLLNVTGLERKILMRYPNLTDAAKSEQLAGIYFDINVATLPNIQYSCTVSSDRIALAKELGKHKEITLKNMLVGGMNVYCKSWLYVIAGNYCGGESINDLHSAVVETTVENFLEAEGKEYFVLFTVDKYESTDKYDLIFQNEAGVILKKK